MPDRSLCQMLQDIEGDLGDAREAVREFEDLRPGARQRLHEAMAQAVSSLREIAERVEAEPPPPAEYPLAPFHRLAQAVGSLHFGHRQAARWLSSVFCREG